MTVAACVNHCNTYGLIYAGVENGVDCCKCKRSPEGRTSARPVFVFFDLMLWITDCGNVLSIIAMNATDSDCNVPCAGDNTEMCGGSERLNLYWSGAGPPPPPTMVDTSSTGAWNLLGCYKYAFMPCLFDWKRICDDSVHFVNSDSNSDRILESPAVTIPGGPSNTTVENCTDECYSEGYVIAGVEWSDQCCTRINFLSSVGFSLLTGLCFSRLRTSYQLSRHGDASKGLYVALLGEPI